MLRRVTHRQPAAPWDGRFVLLAERLTKGYGWRKPVVRDVVIDLK